MVRPGLRRSEIDWENVDIHISREEMERRTVKGTGTAGDHQ